MSDDTHMFLEFAAAYVRGARPDLVRNCAAETVDCGRAGGLKLYPFKRSQVLPRVRAVIGVLHGLQPQSLLDVGSGRGAFLWPLLETFPQLPVTAIDIHEARLAILNAVANGGIARLSPHVMDICATRFDDRQFDMVTILEVLEHLDDPALAAREALRLARRAVIASVPSKEDGNPEHVRLFTKASLTELFENAGAANVNISYVLNHMICVATL